MPSTGISACSSRPRASSPCSRPTRKRAGSPAPGTPRRSPPTMRSAKATAPQRSCASPGVFRNQLPATGYQLEGVPARLIRVQPDRPPHRVAAAAQTILHDKVRSSSPRPVPLSIDGRTRVLEEGTAVREARLRLRIRRRVTKRACLHRPVSPCPPVDEARRASRVQCAVHLVYIDSEYTGVGAS